MSGTAVATAPAPKGHGIKLLAAAVVGLSTLISIISVVSELNALVVVRLVKKSVITGPARLVLKFITHRYAIIERQARYTKCRLICSLEISVGKSDSFCCLFLTTPLHEFANVNTPAHKLFKPKLPFI
jgi:hypothetical protein